jgi:hypothetical protein
MKSSVQKLIILISLTTLLYSCKSDKSRIEDAKQVVTTFVKDLELENYESINKVYPSLNKIGKYWLLYKFEITDSKIENKEVTIYGKYFKGGEIEETIMFYLKVNSEGQYIIDHTKGLSGYFGTNAYKFLKNIGCLQGLETDEEIASACKKREVVFTSLVAQASKAQEESVIMENHSVVNSYGYLSGDITCKNTSDTDIPAFSYDLYVLFYDNEGNIIYTEKSPTSNVYKIPAHGAISTMVHQPYIRGMSKIGIQIKLIKTDWLEYDIANSPSKAITCDKIDEIIKTQL